MTMRINGDKGLLQQGVVRKARQEQQGVKESSRAQNTDKVSFSSVLQQVDKANELAVPVAKAAPEGLSAALLNTPTYVQDVAETQEAERTNKIAELKAQIADGSYQPDLKKVASSLLTFIAEGRQA
ncbi:MAG: flagellar biosynthesis anti-sigma factor FlgM [Desulfobacteraceae bacterium 4572_35.1]|nr:MAG: flagellar biosynthesis anti-sigma factor FlgM [Desulfobacteraceae bacterium 4572_35.1]